jgi:hypothetical protein
VKSDVVLFLHFAFQLIDKQRNIWRKVGKFTDVYYRFLFEEPFQNLFQIYQTESELRDRQYTDIIKSSTKFENLSEASQYSPSFRTFFRDAFFFYFKTDQENVSDFLEIFNFICINCRSIFTSQELTQVQQTKLYLIPWEFALKVDRHIRRITESEPLNQFGEFVYQILRSLQMAPNSLLFFVENEALFIKRVTQFGWAKMKFEEVVVRFLNKLFPMFPFFASSSLRNT